MIKDIGFFISNKNHHKSENYRKVPKFSDARKLCCNLLKIQEKMLNLSLMWVYTVCPDLSVRKLRIIMVELYTRVSTN